MNTRSMIIIHDLIMAAAAWILAWGVRFNFYFNFPDWDLCFYTIPSVVIVQGAIFWLFNVYRGIWRFASLPDLWNIIKSSIIGTICVAVFLFFMIRLEGVPRSIFVLYPVFLIFLLGGARLGYRIFRDNPFNTASIQIGKKALIIGAGRAGDMLVRDMLRNDNYTPIGFLDDNPELNKSELHGVPVLGSIEFLSKLSENIDIDVIVIAVPSANNEQMQRIVNLCEKTNVPIQTLPRINEIGKNDLFESKLHTLSIEDLLGREKVDLDWGLLKSGISRKVVLVTGGGGSIGRELCAQIARIDPELLIIYEKNEFGLYSVNSYLSNNHPKLNLKIVLGDIRDEAKVDHVFSAYKPDIVFHAAAYKHVPILEYEVREAMLNNIYGTKILAEKADKYECKKFIFISTDKAVNPSNILGKSKRIAELYCAGINRLSETQFVTVRFGNVLGSDGSVVPLFRKQIENGGPVTVTDPDITRYFMTIEEACQLIMQAGAMGEGGGIYVLDMGEPVKIAYLAEQMIRLSGLVPDKDIKIEYMGLRPGEKLYEELFYDCEKLEETIHKKIFLANQSKHNWDEMKEFLSKLKHECDEFREDEIRKILDEYMEESMKEANSNNNLVNFIQK